jgi:hypothetical protein
MSQYCAHFVTAPGLKEPAAASVHGRGAQPLSREQGVAAVRLIQPPRGERQARRYVGGRGRDRPCGRPPAQIRTSGRRPHAGSSSGPRRACPRGPPGPRRRWSAAPPVPRTVPAGSSRRRRRGRSRQLPLGDSAPRRGPRPRAGCRRRPSCTTGRAGLALQAAVPTAPLNRSRYASPRISQMARSFRGGTLIRWSRGRGPRRRSSRSLSE